MTKASQKVTRSDMRAQGKKSSRNKLLWIAGLGAAIVAATAFAFVAFAPPAVPVLDGVAVYANLPRNHSEGPQTYAQTPPVGATWRHTSHRCQLTPTRECSVAC